MYSILVVDDVKEIRELLVELLALKGYVVSTAADAVEALHIIENHHVDLMLTDIDMPRENGISLMRKAISKHSNLPVVLMSGGTHLTIPEDVPFLKKPLQPKQMWNLIAEILNKSK